MSRPPPPWARKRLRHPAHTAEPTPAPDALAALLRVLPVPLGEVGAVLAGLRVPRHAGQTALNEAIKAGEVRLAHSGSGVLVVALEGSAP